MTSDNMSVEKYRMKRLDRGGDYTPWASQVSAMLTELDLEEFIEREPDANAAEDVKRKDKKCKARLLLCVDGPLRRVVEDATSAKKAWDALKVEYLGSLKVRRPALLGDVRVLKQGHVESVEEYGDRARALLTKLDDAEVASADMMVTDALLQGLKGTLRMVCLPSLTKMADQGFDKVLLELKNLTRLLQDNAPDKTRADGRVFYTDGRKREERRRCFICGKVGHLKKDCWKNKQQGSPNQAHAMMTYTKGDLADVILFDSGSSHHVVHDATRLKDLRPSAVKNVKLGGNEVHDVIGEGEAFVSGGPAGTIQLKNVLYVPSMSVNLLSGIKATAAGFVCTLVGLNCKVVSAKGEMVLTGRKNNGLYHLDCHLEEQQQATEAQVNLTSPSEVWHKRLGHPGQSAMRKVAKVAGLEEDGVVSKMENCEVCAKAKQSRESYKPSTSRAEKKLELVHSDVLGPMEEESFEGARYVVTLMDDCTSYAETACVNTKMDVRKWLQETIIKWQRQTDHKVKKLRSDRGSEFLSDLQDFLKQQGIIHQRSAVYTPEQNGRAERLNRTLIEKTRALLLQHKLPKVFWASAMDTATKLRNWLPTAASDDSPHKLFYGVAPDYSRVRVYGCKVFVHVPKTKYRKKLDARAEEGIFLGYEQDCKAWRVFVWRDDGFKCVTSSNVKFVENERPKLTMFEEEKEGEIYLPELLAQEDQAQQEQEESEGEDEDEAEEEVSALAEGSDSEEEVEPAEERRYPVRQRNPPVDPYSGYVNAVMTSKWDDPTLEEALKRSDAELWKEAINSEKTSLIAKNVYEEIDESLLPKGCKPLPSKGVCKIKRDIKGDIDKYKVRIVAKGFRQVAGRDYDEVFAPTARQATFRLLCSHAVEHDLELRQFDVSTAFLNGELEEEVYIKLPEELGGKVWRLKKALYGLKQAARAWHIKLREVMTKIKYRASDVDPCLFIQDEGDERTLVLFHVDDGLVVAPRKQGKVMIETIGKVLEIKDLQEASVYLGIEIRRRQDGGLGIGQEKYVRDLLSKFGMENCKPVRTPMEPNKHLGKEGQSIESEDTPYAELVGSLLYLAVNTRPDIAHALGVLSRYMSSPKEHHWQAAKRVLRYLAGTPDFGLVYVKGQETFVAYCDADFAGDLDNRKSTSGGVIIKSKAAVDWLSKLQSTVATSTCESECNSGKIVAQEGLWVRRLQGEISGQVGPLPLMCDNQSALVLMGQPLSGLSSKKHVEVAFQFVRDRVMRGDVQLSFVPTETMWADVFTKPVPAPRFEQCRKAIGVMKY